MRKTLLLLLLLLIVAQVEAIEIKQTTFQAGEQVYFTSCQAPTLSCGELRSAPWEECKIYTFNTNDLTCNNPVISTETTQMTLFIANYEQNLNKFSQRRETSSLNIARQIYIKNLLGETQEIEDLIEILKQNRIERYKCWSRTNTCDLEKTIDILKYLTDAGINRTNRIYQDAMLWVESRQNKKENENFEFYFQSNSETTCTLKRGETTLNTIQVNKTTEYIIRDYEAGQELTASCQDNYCFRVRDQFGETIQNQCREGEENVRFSIEAGCFGAHTRVSCSPLITGKALSIKHLRQENLNKGKDWIEDNIRAAPIAAQRFLDNNEALANIYMYKATKNEDIRTWIWYSQNNDGSFGRQNKEFTTLEAIRIFEQNQEYEWMQDAINYIERTRPIQGYNEASEESRFFEIFSPERMPIIITPPILEGVNDPVQFKLESSTQFELEVENPPELLVDINHEGNIATGTAEIIRTEDRRYTGYITFIEEGYEKKVPYSIVKMPTLELDFEQEYYLTQRTGSINVPIIKSNSALNCKITADSTINPLQTTLTNQRSIRLDYEAEIGNRLVQIIYECETEFGVIEQDYFVTIRHYETSPFTVIKQFNTITDEPGRVIVRNNIPEDITVEFEMQRAVNDYEIESPITIPRGQEANVYIYKTESTPLNVVEPNTLITKGLGYETETEFEIFLDGIEQEIPITTFRDQRLVSLPLIIIFILGTLAIASVILYYNYSKRKEEEEKEKKVEKELEKIKPKKEEKSNKELGEVLVAIDKMMGDDDEKVTEDLKQKGFEMDEIKEMLKELEEIQSK
ncbi:MAG: hypothetical protein ACMXX7_02225 [Candidatus Woesearchaeota archaeon]